MTAAPRCRNPRCGRPRKRRADNRGWTGYAGYCPACAERWRRAGRPAEGPPAAPSGTQRAARISASLRAHHAAHGQSEAALGALALGTAAAAASRWRAQAAKAGRVQDYAWLRSFGESRQDAAAQVGVAWRVTYGYDRVLGEMAARGEAAA